MRFPFWRRDPPQGLLLARCPICDELLDAECMNIKEGVALCPGCKTLSPLSQLSPSDRSSGDILADPPLGCGVFEYGQGAIVRASLRSLLKAGSMIFATFFWNSILSIFVLQAIAGVVYQLTGPLPSWYWAPDLSNGVPQINGQPMGVGMTVFLCVFLLPFVIIGIGMPVTAALFLLGRIDVVIDERDSHIATGIGPLLWRRRFDPHAVERIGTGTSLVAFDRTEGDPPAETIELHADRTIRFGTLLAPERAEWMKAVLRALLLDPDRRRHQPALPVIDWIKPE